MPPELSRGCRDSRREYWGLVSITFLLLLTCGVGCRCSHSTSLVGQYSYELAGGIDHLALRADHTFEHSITLGGSTKTLETGKWILDQYPNRCSRLALYGYCPGRAIDRDFDCTSKPPDTRGVYLLEASQSMFGQIYLDFEPGSSYRKD